MALSTGIFEVLYLSAAMVDCNVSGHGMTILEDEQPLHIAP